MPIARLAIIVAGLAALYLPSGTGAEPDAVLRSRLIGIWEETRLVDNERYEQRIALTKDGQFEVKGTHVEDNKPTPFTWRGKWQVKNGKFLYSTTFSDPPDLYPPGESFEDTIVSVSSTEWVMIEQSTGNESRSRRVK